MGSSRSTLLSCAVAVLAGWGSAHAASPPAVSATDKDASADAIECRSDKDCPVMACGPCTPGAPITHAMYPGPSCAINPCLDASAVCNAEHRCEIGPGTRKNPRVWTKPKS